MLTKSRNASTFETSVATEVATDGEIGRYLREELLAAARAGEVALCGSAYAIMATAKDSSRASVARQGHSLGGAPPTPPQTSPLWTTT
jgi:hypothetical protein